MLICDCAACHKPITANPIYCPSIRVNGEKQPICESCFEIWNEIHRVSLGLPPIALHPQAYEPADENQV